MLETAFAILSLVSAQPVTIGADVIPFEFRKCRIPMQVPQQTKDRAAYVKLFCSVDRGTTWTFVSDHQVTETQLRFVAPKDGEYWFSVQVANQDLTHDPSDLKNLTPLLKVYFNEQRRPLKKVPG